MKTISKTAKIAETAIIHDDVIIEDNVIIHDYVVIYPKTIIKKGVEIYDHCVLGKLPTSPGSVARKLKIEYKELIIDEYSILCPSVVLYTGSKIGKHTLLGDFCSIREECEVGDYCIVSRNVSVNYNTKIGNRVKIMDNSHITGDMIIEDDVFISVLVSSTNDNTMGRDEYSENHVRGPHIKRGVTIGASSILLPNTIIGENALIGAGSIVTKNVPDNEVWIGSPAKFIRNIEND